MFLEPIVSVTLYDRRRGSDPKRKTILFSLSVAVHFNELRFRCDVIGNLK